MNCNCGEYSADPCRCDNYTEVDGGTFGRLDQVAGFLDLDREPPPGFVAYDDDGNPEPMTELPPNDVRVFFREADCGD